VTTGPKSITALKSVRGRPVITPVRRFGWIFWRVFLAMFFGGLTLGVAVYMFPQQVLTIDSGEVKGDELVVLGGGDGRAERAAELFRQGVAPRVTVTGYGDCASNIATLKKNGVPADVITAEPNALTTLENAKRSIPLLRQHGDHRVILVTSWFHSRRALACFEHVAPDLQFFSRPAYVEFYPGQPDRKGFNQHVNFEYAKLMGYWLRYGVWPL
jgi:uncharacterized SAM-binding protein YcdF (DUF218 family)